MRNIPRSLILLWLVVTASAVMFRWEYGLPPEAAKVAAESTAIFLLAAFFLGWTRIGKLLHQVQTDQRWFVLSLLLLTCFAHLTGQTRVFFPFVSWDMYTCSPEEEAVRFYEIEGVTAEGEVLALIPAELVPPLNRRRMVNRTRELVDAWNESNSSDQLQSEQALDAWLNAIGHLANAESSAHIQAVQLMECELEPSRYRGADTPVQRQIVRRVPVAGQQLIAQE